MSTENKIIMFTKQNDSIYTSLKARNIEFTRIDVLGLDNPEDKLTALIDENNKLKEVVKANKPIPIPKESKPVPPKKESEPNTKKDDDEEESYEEIKTSYNTITNMEDIKRAFCNREYETFETLIQQHPFRYYNVQYKYASDKDGSPDFVAKNLVRGFVRNLDDYRKYLFVCFRCVVNSSEKKYSYPSMWIINSSDNISKIIGSMYEDFDFVEITSEQIKQFHFDFRKTDFDISPNIIEEIYAH